MYSFFVLGLIPGTNFQITFQVWFDVVEVLVAVTGILWLHRLRHPLAAQLEMPTPRRSLPASQFHLRQMPSISAWRNLHTMLLHSRKVIIERSIRFYQEYYPPMYDDF